MPTTLSRQRFVSLLNTYVYKAKTNIRAQTSWCENATRANPLGFNPIKYADTFKKRHIRFDLINNALTNVQKRSSVYFHFRYIPFDCIGKQAIILNNLLLDFFVLFSCEWFMKRIAFFDFVFWVTLLVSDISNHLVLSRYKGQILVLTY